MSGNDIKALLQDAQKNSSLRLKLSQDRTSKELASSANQEGYSISERDAKRILAGAYLTSDDVSQSERQEILGGIALDFLDRVEDRLDRDFRILTESDAWERAEEFYDYVCDS